MKRLCHGVTGSTQLASPELGCEPRLPDCRVCRGGASQWVPWEGGEGGLLMGGAGSVCAAM